MTALHVCSRQHLLCYVPKKGFKEARGSRYSTHQRAGPQMVFAPMLWSSYLKLRQSAFLYIFFTFCRDWTITCISYLYRFWIVLAVSFIRSNQRKAKQYTHLVLCVPRNIPIKVLNDFWWQSTKKLKKILKVKLVFENRALFPTFLKAKIDTKIFLITVFVNIKRDDSSHAFSCSF